MKLENRSHRFQRYSTLPVLRRSGGGPARQNRLIFYLQYLGNNGPTINSAGKHGAPRKAGFQDIVNLGIVIGDPAADLPVGFWGFSKGKSGDFWVAGLFLHPGIVQAPAINTGGVPGFQAIGFKSQLNQLFGNAGSRPSAALPPEKFFSPI